METPCDPIVSECPGGWLAVTPSSHVLRIGVVGHTREEARARFQDALAAWEVLHERAQAEARSG
jgi:hypothetical protein